MDNSVFVDWLTLRQEHPEGGLPVINGGRVWAVDPDGEVEWTTDQAMDMVGSHDTRIRVRCDGYRVELSGNVGRFNRRDNVFGFSFDECLSRANELLNLWSLPPFTRGQLVAYVQDLDRPGKLEWTGAVVTRIDVCQNLCLWNRENGQVLLRYLAAKQKGRVKVGVASDGSSVMWGYGSKYANFIAYDKAVEMEKHGKRQKADPEVLELVRELGVVRMEAKFKTRFLTQKGMRFLAEVSMAKIEQLFRDERNKVMVQEVQVDSYNEIPMPFRATAKDWRDGVDLRSSMKHNTFYRHRRALLRYGIDIAVASEVKTLPPKVIELNPAALVAPEWYRRKYG